MDSSASKRRLCVVCAKLHTPSDFCPIHKEEPLLDPEDDDVRFELMALDDRAKARLYTMLGVGGGVIGFILGLVAYFVVKSIFEELAEAYRMEIVLGPTAGLVALGLLVAKNRYRPRFTQWTGDDHTG